AVGPTVASPRSQDATVMLRWLKWLIPLALVIGVGVAVAGPVSSWWRTRALPKYRAAAVARGRVETTVNSTGTIKPVRSVSIGAFVSGPIAEIYVDFNSPVKAK